MYASSHHVGIGYGSSEGMLKGVPFKLDENGNESILPENNEADP